MPTTQQSTGETNRVYPNLTYSDGMQVSGNGDINSDQGYWNTTASYLQRMNNIAMAGEIYNRAQIGVQPSQPPQSTPEMPIDMTDEVGSIEDISTKDDNPLGMSTGELENNLARARSIINGETNFGIRFGGYFDTFEIEEQYADDEDEHDD